jgi:hypothetical protein
MIQTIRMAFIIDGRVSMMLFISPIEMFLKWRSSVVRNLTLSFASMTSLASSE